MSLSTVSRWDSGLLGGKQQSFPKAEYSGMAIDIFQQVLNKYENLLKSDFKHTNTDVI